MLKASDGSRDDGRGGWAVAVAMVALFGGKAATEELYMRGQGYPPYAWYVTADRDYLVSDEADRMVTYESDVWGAYPMPPWNMTLTFEDDYAPEVWAEASRRFDALPQPEKDARKANAEAWLRAQHGENVVEFKLKQYSYAFGFFDIVWFGFAGFSAFMLGSARGGSII